jgi:hypothetical protein
MAQDVCSVKIPLVSVAGPEHTVNCHFWDEVPPPPDSAHLLPTSAPRSA